MHETQSFQAMSEGINIDNLTPENMAAHAQNVLPRDERTRNKIDEIMKLSPLRRHVEFSSLIEQNNQLNLECERQTERHDQITHEITEQIGHTSEDALQRAHVLFYTPDEYSQREEAMNENNRN
jgi:hypothetical protein